MPLSRLVKPPSMALSPPMVLCCKTGVMVTLKLVVSTMMPPLRTLICDTLVTNAVLLPVGINTPPLKLKVEFAAEDEFTLSVRSVPPSNS